VFCRTLDALAPFTGDFRKEATWRIAFFAFDDWESFFITLVEELPPDIIVTLMTKARYCGKT